MTVTMHIYPDPLLVAEALDGLADDIEDSDGPMLESLALIMESISDNFLDEGPGWAPWSLSYALSKGKRPHGPLLEQDMILLRTTELADSTADPANYRVERDTIEWTGEAAPDYGDYHLTGTEKMPERNFLKMSSAAQEGILDVWTDWLSRAVEAVSAISFRGGAWRDAIGRFAKAP